MEERRIKREKRKRVIDGREMEGLDGSEMEERGTAGAERDRWKMIKERER